MQRHYHSTTVPVNNKNKNKILNTTTYYHSNSTSSIKSTTPVLIKLISNSVLEVQ